MKKLKFFSVHLSVLLLLNFSKNIHRFQKMGLFSAGPDFEAPALMDGIAEVINHSCKKNHEQRFAVGLLILVLGGWGWVILNVGDMLANRDVQIEADLDFHDVIQGNYVPEVVICHGIPNYNVHIGEGDCRLYEHLAEAAMGAPCVNREGVPNNEGKCSEIKSTMLNILNSQGKEPINQTCVKINLNEAVYDSRAVSVRCIGNFYDRKDWPAGFGSGTGGGGSDSGGSGAGGSGTGDSGTGSGGGTVGGSGGGSDSGGSGTGDSGTGGSDGGDSSDSTDCSGMGVTWGPGIAPPPDGCGGGGGGGGGRQRQLAGAGSTKVPNVMLVSMYSPLQHTPKSGMLESQFITDDRMSFVEWSTTRIMDETGDETETTFVFDGSSTTTGHSLEDGEFSIFLRPKSFGTTDIHKYHNDYYEYIDEIGGYTGAVELVLGLFALFFWMLRPTHAITKQLSAKKNVPPVTPTN